MFEDQLQLDAYFERIEYQGPATPTEETLFQLHNGQIMHIPFENFSVLMGEPIALDPASLFQKLVQSQRGGYCFELNGLLEQVLRQLGFQVTTLAARVMIGGVVQQKSHKLMLIELNGRRWLVDVGFGGNCPVAPLPLEPGVEVDQRLEVLRLVTDPDFGYILQHKVRDEWRPLYGFTLEPYYPADYRMMNFYTSHSPDSPFIHNPICAIAAPDARVILNNMELKIRHVNGESHTMELADETMFRDALRSYFGIRLPAGAQWSRGNR
ncbi:N-hydroxyarylamine O-acetyltransferase [Thermosporothrix hazakensis]|jgi:N-hydroxyarylamine O-acetyltransferase|uniref:N-hydroxyarylamine O-acetyltransferase n=2 Tax=Thermosporothrix TaxID=768650 RepID=A0A326UMX3_THEHA|nr:arylamine N-acetyltransferase [Thermosporothrix hazakensis]PZW34493.1 N-hydroxyarylamine O-acetyltransferase [Thermosporothrix hazakensis]BBH85614.1 N-hydroxyarylamine O-acetyltransferase [Thermosporothrix sp. COM3]GCE45957.1 N-hydroxyarylamine O-acetyltransferase [Thermosporothrix hazakensis]